MTNDEAERIIDRLGNSINNLDEEYGVSPPFLTHCVLDESLLPFSKSSIKEAILITVKRSKDANIRSIWEQIFIQLAYFQPNVAGKVLGLTKLDQNDINFEKEDIELFAKSISEKAEEYELFEPIIKTEEKKLEEEFSRFIDGGKFRTNPKKKFDSYNTPIKKIKVLLELLAGSFLLAVAIFLIFLIFSQDSIPIIIYILLFACLLFGFVYFFSVWNKFKK